jgi:hypothetical protein
MKTLSDELGFIAIDGSISFAFETKNSFATNDVGIGSGGNNGPSVVAESRIKFYVHSSTPSRMLGSRGVGCRFDIIGACGGNECLWERIPNESL